jgi:hypothetical protein
MHLVICRRPATLLPGRGPQRTDKEEKQWPCQSRDGHENLNKGLKNGLPLRMTLHGDNGKILTVSVRLHSMDDAAEGTADARQPLAARRIPPRNADSPKQGRLTIARGRAPVNR